MFKVLDRGTSNASLIIWILFISCTVGSIFNKLSPGSFNEDFYLQPGLFTCTDKGLRLFFFKL